MENRWPTLFRDVVRIMRFITSVRRKYFTPPVGSRYGKIKTDDVKFRIPETTYKHSRSSRPRLEKKFAKRDCVSSGPGETTDARTAVLAVCGSGPAVLGSFWRFIIFADGTPLYTVRARTHGRTSLCDRRCGSWRRRRRYFQHGLRNLIMWYDVSTGSRPRACDDWQHRKTVFRSGSLRIGLRDAKRFSARPRDGNETSVSRTLPPPRRRRDRVAISTPLTRPKRSVRLGNGRNLRFTVPRHFII